MKEYLEYINKDSSKFWQIELNDCAIDITFGKIGTSGKSSRKELQDPQKASLYFRQEVIKKLKEGYNDPKVPILTLENTTYYNNSKPFKHDDSVEGMYYYSAKERVISNCKNYLYIWSKDGILLGTYKFNEKKHFFGEVFIRQHGNTSEFLFYIHDMHYDHIYIFDLMNDSFELVCDKDIEPPFEGYYRNIDLDDKYIYFGCSNGFILLDHELNMVKTLKSPHEQEDSNGVAVNASSQLIAFVQWSEERDDKDTVTIVDITGKLISEFKTWVHNQFGHMISFNKEGTLVYIVSTNDNEIKVELWDPQDGKLLKQISNSVSSGYVMSFCMSKKEKWLVTRSAGIDINLWNLDEERVHWVRLNQPFSGNICFTEDLTLYQSDGNRIYKINMDNDNDFEFEGMSGPCSNIFFDEERQHLWVASSNKIFRYSSKGKMDYWTEARSFDICSYACDKGSSKLLMSRSIPNRGGRDFLWLNLDDLHLTPFLSGCFVGINFDKDIVISCEDDTNKISIWNHNGRLLKEMKTKVSGKIYLLKEQRFLITNNKKSEVWSIDENELILSFKDTVEKVKAHAKLPYFITATKNTVKLWDGKADNPLCLELLVDQVKEIISETILDVFLIIDATGRIYTLNPVSLELKQLINMNKLIDKAVLSATGKLYVATQELDIFELELNQYLNIHQTIVPKVVKDTSVRVINEEDLNQKNILECLQSINWDEISEENFLWLRSALCHLEMQDGIGEEHHYFTERMLEKGAKLRHQFAHEEEYSSSAMSSDGRYLAVGTGVGENYEEDGTIQIWEIASGRCVNLLKRNYGGIGWPDYPFNLQWSPDNKMIGASLNTNNVASIDPFGTTDIPLATVSVTDGWNRPPAWCWLKDSSHLVVSCWNDSEIPACICKTNKLHIYEYDARWFSKKIDPSISSKLKDLELEPYTVCHATKDGKLIYGYNDHYQIFGIDVKSRQLSWVLEIDSPIEFSPLDDFFIYLENGQIQIADLNTGKVRERILDSVTAEGFEFAPNSQRYAAYKGNKITVFDYNKKIVDFEVKTDLLSQNYFESELRSVRFNHSGDKIACLLSNGEIEIWSFTNEAPIKSASYSSKASGIYWGEALVGVSSNYLCFLKEDGTLIHYCDKEAQVEAYQKLYPDTPSPLQIGKVDFAKRFDLWPLYPFKYNSKVEWLAAVETGVVITSCKDIDELDKHLSYTWKNKYAWPLCWGKDFVYDNIEQAKSVN